MKRRVLYTGIFAALLMIGADAFGQRGRGRDRDDRDRDRDRPVERVERGRDRDGRRGRGQFTSNYNHRRNPVVRRNGRNERVVGYHRRYFDSYRNYGYPYRDYDRVAVIYDYDYRNGKRYRIRRGVRPSQRHIWITGHWRFNRRLGREVWVDAHWAQRGRNHRWIDGHYESFRGRRTWVPGCWTIIY